MSSTGLPGARSSEQVAALVSNRGEEQNFGAAAAAGAAFGAAGCGAVRGGRRFLPLHLAENKAVGTVRIYTDAVRWFAAAHLLKETDKSRWEQVEAADVRQWLVYLLGLYSEAYACQQYRSLEQFFRWLALGEDLPSPMATLRPPKVAGKPVPFQQR